MPTLDAQDIWHLAVATLGGLAVGVERQLSGHAHGTSARFAGLRTFTLMGLGAGLSGWLVVGGVPVIGGIVLAGLTALTVVAYLRASGNDVDGTTEVAAMVVIAASAMAGAGAPRLGSAAVAITTLLLVEKRRLHGLVTRLQHDDILAGARFAVMAVVILPLIPVGPYGPADTIRPRLLWSLVLFFSALSFVGVILRRLVGSSRGFVLAGAVGGLLSSTSVTLTYARLSRVHPEAATALAAGVMAANTVLVPRVLLATSFLAPPLALALWPLLISAFAIAAVGAGLGLMQGRSTSKAPETTANPLQIRAALEMAVLFQLVLFAVAATEAYFGQSGIYGSAAVLGLADVDALTVSMSDLTERGTAAQVGATALAIGITSNTIVKLTIALVAGRGRFRAYAGLGLAGMAVAILIATWLRAA